MKRTLHIEIYARKKRTFQLPPVNINKIIHVISPAFAFGGFRPMKYVYKLNSFI